MTETNASQNRFTGIVTSVHSNPSAMTNPIELALVVLSEGGIKEYVLKSLSLKTIYIIVA